jgi:hypothetical protein
LLAQFARLAFSLEQFEVYREVTDAMRRCATERTTATTASVRETAGRGSDADYEQQQLTFAVFDVLDALVELHASKSRSGDVNGGGSGSSGSADKKANQSSKRHPPRTTAAATASTPSRFRFSLELEPLQRATAVLVGVYARSRSATR